MKKEDKAKIKNALDSIKDICMDELQNVMDKLLTAFDGMTPEAKKIEFAEHIVAQSCIHQILATMKSMDEDKRKEMCEKYPEAKMILAILHTYLEMGLGFGYAEKQEEK